MNCLDNWIGLRGCGMDVPGSGYYINDQPGFTLDSIDAQATDEQMTYKGAWEAIQTSGKLTFHNELKTLMKRRYLFRDAPMIGKFGKLNGGNFTSIIDGQSYGVRLFFGLGYGLYTGFRIDRLLLQAEFEYIAEDNITVNIYDINDGTLLFTKEYTGTNGMNSLLVGQFFIPSDPVQGIAVQVVYSQAVQFTQTTSYFWNNCICPVTSGSYDDSTLTFTSDNNGSNGLVIDFSIGCSIDAFICHNLSALTSAWLYHCCITALEYRLHSRELNKWSISTNEVETLTKQYESKRYDELMNFLQQYRFEESFCFKCNEQTRLTYFLP